MNLGCFAIQAMQAGLPDTLKAFLSDITPCVGVGESVYDADFGEFRVFAFGGV